MSQLNSGEIVPLQHEEEDIEYSRNVLLSQLSALKSRKSLSRNSQLDVRSSLDGLRIGNANTREPRLLTSLAAVVPSKSWISKWKSLPIVSAENARKSPSAFSSPMAFNESQVSRPGIDFPNPGSRSDFSPSPQLRSVRPLGAMPALGAASAVATSSMPRTLESTLHRRRSSP